MLETIKKQWQAKIALLIFVGFSLWWVYINIITQRNGFQYDYFGDFGDLYGLMALWGAICGIFISFKWGGMKSLMGRAILFFSLGLFLQEFGQITYSIYYDFITREVPYPSLGDLGFFGSIPFYILGIFFLAKASGVKLGLQSVANKIQAVVIPLVMLVIGYWLFLRGYEFDWNNPIKTILDFGYPLGQAIYVSLALLTYLLSRKVLGGIMRNNILFILFAFCIQFLADYNFLYQNSKGTWINSGYGDYLYLLAYFLMTFGLLQLKTVLSKLQSS